jgi:hypothetical protein
MPVSLDGAQRNRDSYRMAEIGILIGKTRRACDAARRVALFDEAARHISIESRTACGRVVQRVSDHTQLAQRTWREREEENMSAHLRGCTGRTRTGRPLNFGKRMSEIFAHGPLHEEQLEGAWFKRPSGAANFCNANLRQSNCRIRSALRPRRKPARWCCRERRVLQRDMRRRKRGESPELVPHITPGERMSYLTRRLIACPQ